MGKYLFIIKILKKKKGNITNKTCMLLFVINSSENTFLFCLSRVGIYKSIFVFASVTYHMAWGKEPVHSRGSYYDIILLMVAQRTVQWNEGSLSEWQEYNITMPCQSFGREIIRVWTKVLHVASAIFLYAPLGVDMCSGLEQV